MVLKSIEREETIQLLAMDPQVCGKLLTHHRKGNRVDVDALRDQIPLRRVSEKAPRWDLARTEACDGGKVFWWTLLVVCEYLRIYRVRIRVRRPPRGPRALKACPPGARLAGLWPPQATPGPIQVLWVSSSPRKIIANVLFRLDSV